MINSSSRSARPVLVLAVALLAACAAAVALRGVTDAHAALPKGEKGFLRLTRDLGKGNHEMVKGGSNDRLHRDEIEIKGYHVGWQGGCRPLVVKTEPNPSWPVLAQYAANGVPENFDGRLEIVKSGRDPRGAKAGKRTLTRDAFRGYEFSGGDIDDVDEEDGLQTVTISYDFMTYTVRSQRADGTLGSPVTANINCNNNT